MSKYLDFAILMASQAGRNIMKYQGQALEREYNDRTHFRTLVDTENDALARRLIGAEFPDHGILSEEDIPKIGTSGFRWVIDPLDGTINFASGITDHFTFSAGLCRGRTPIIGVINAPRRGEFYTAESGAGARRDGNQIHVSKLADLNKVLIVCDSGKFNRAAHVPYVYKLMEQNAVTCIFNTACATVPLCLVASGSMHAYLATSLAPEDMTAAVCIIREAGGKVTNLKGEEWQLGDPSILAANPVLHAKLIEFFGLTKAKKPRWLELWEEFCERFRSEGF